MNKTVIAGGIVAIAIAVSIAYGAVANPGGNEEKRADSEIWNFRFSGPEFHDVASHQFAPISLDKNVPYKFEFVPMGDSPERLRITVGGDGHGVRVFSEEFILQRELVDTGISKYYTWEYVGDRFFQISDKECYEKDATSSTIFKKQSCIYELNVERIGNLMGSVSIGIEKLDRSI